MLDLKLRELRLENGYTQSFVAEYLNVQQNTYSQYETGTIALTAEILIRLADFYHCSVDYLLDRTNDPTPYEKNRK